MNFYYWQCAFTEKYKIHVFFIRIFSNIVILLSSVVKQSRFRYKSGIRFGQCENV